MHGIGICGRPFRQFVGEEAERHAPHETTFHIILTEPGGVFHPVLDQPEWFWLSFRWPPQRPLIHNLQIIRRTSQFIGMRQPLREFGQGLEIGIMGFRRDRIFPFQLTEISPGNLGVLEVATVVNQLAEPVISTKFSSGPRRFDPHARIGVLHCQVQQFIPLRVTDEGECSSRTVGMAVFARVSVREPRSQPLFAFGSIEWMRPFLALDQAGVGRIEQRDTDKSRWQWIAQRTVEQLGLRMPGLEVAENRRPDITIRFDWPASGLDNLQSSFSRAVERQDLQNEQ